MTSLKGQLTFNFAPLPPRYGRADFITTERNHSVLKLADAWLASDELGLAICGPAGAGKTHLAKIIADSAALGAVHWFSSHDFADGGSIIRVEDLSIEMGDLLVIDGVQAAAPRLLFLLFETVKAARARVIFAGQGEPIEWAKDLKDMQTRLQAMPRIHITEPDEALMQEVIIKLFKDKQIDVDPEVASYAAARLQRRFSAAQYFVRAADALAAERRGPVTKPLARDAIEALFAAV